MAELVIAENLRKTFGGMTAVDGVSLSISSGEIYGLVGPDGAGKTTTLRMLIGALQATSGEIKICNHDMHTQVEQARSQVGYLSQRFSLYDDLTVLENIRFFAELRGLSAGEWLPRCTEILNFVGLDEFKDRKAGYLSGGMKQKLGLASAMVTHPKVLLLDEPTTGVDPVTRQDFWQLIIQLVAPASSERYSTGGEIQSGCAVLLTTPYMDEASRCHRVGFMSRGRIIAEGTPFDLRNNLGGRILEVIAPDLLKLRKIASQVEGIEDIRSFGDRLHLRVKLGAGKRVIDTLVGYTNTSVGSFIKIKEIPPSLEDVFIALSGVN